MTIQIDVTDYSPLTISGARNTSKEHRRLAAMSIRWTASRVTRRGIRSARELYLTRGYVADAVALASLQWRHYCQFVPADERLPNAFTRTRDYWAFVFECKVSLADFHSTFSNAGSNRLTAIGNLHFVVTPKKLVIPEQVPSFWGLLQSAGTGLQMIKKPIIQSQTDSVMDNIAYRMLWHMDRGHDANAV